MKAIERHFHVTMFITLYSLVQTLDESLMTEHWKLSYTVLSRELTCRKSSLHVVLITMLNKVDKTIPCDHSKSHQPELSYNVIIIMALVFQKEIWNFSLNNFQQTNLNLGWPAGQLKLCFFFRWFVSPEPLVYRCPQTWHSYRFTSIPWKNSKSTHIQNYMENDCVDY